MNTRKFALAALGLVLSVSVGCGDDSGKEGVNVSPVSVHQALTDNTTNIGARVAASLVFMEQSGLLTEGLNSFGGDEGCLAEPIDGSGADFDTGDCVSEEVTFESDDVNEGAAELAQLLEERIFADANIESQDSKTITYLVSGDTFCAVDEVSSDPGCVPDVDFDCGVAEGPDPDCIQSVDDAEVRLRVTSPADGDLDIALLVGPERHNALYLELHEDLVAAELDLGGIKGAILHLAPADDAPDLPDTMEGRVRAELKVNSATSVTASLSVLQALSVADDEYAISLGQAMPAFSITADGAAERIESSLNLGTLSAHFPVTSYEETWDENDNFTETEETHTYDLFLAGASASTVLEGDLDTIAFTNLGIGDSTSTLGMDGVQVLAVDLNADSGRRLDAKLQTTEDAPILEVSPELALKLAFSFGNLTEPLADMEEWMLDEVLNITLNGADAPQVRLGDDLEVIAGELTISALNEGTTHTVAAGMCLLGEESVEVTVADGDVLDPPIDEVTTSLLGDLEVGACGGAAPTPAGE